MSLPLEGIRVLDLSQVFAMPGAGMYLADQGADVIKIEQPNGDIGRWVLTMAPIKDESRAFWVLNRNKRSVVIDLQQQAGRDLMYRLVKQSDVVLHTLRLGVDKKLGMDYASVRRHNPRIIYVGFTAWGKHGPLAKLRGYDLLVQGLAGMSGRRSMPDGKPRGTGIWGIDLAASIMVPYAICLALRQRDQSGEGQEIDCSLLQSAVALQMVDMVTVRGHTEPPGATDAVTQATYLAYKCSDGLYVQIAIAANVEWGNMCRATGLEHLIEDPRFVDNPARLENSSELVGLLSEVFAKRTSLEWCERFVQYDAPGINVLPPSQVFDHPQVQANDLFIDIEQPGIGTARMVNIPFRLSGASGHNFRPSPSLGQHTDEVLREMGVTDAELATLRKKNVIK